MKRTTDPQQKILTNLNWNRKHLPCADSQPECSQPSGIASRPLGHHDAWLSGEDTNMKTFLNPLMAVNGVLMSNKI